MIRILRLAALILPTATLLSAGGGWIVLSLGQPSAHPDPVARDSAFVVRVTGCAGSAVNLRVTAEGLLNGRRYSIPIEPVRIAEAARPEDPTALTVAVPKAWPLAGSWVVKVVGSTTVSTQSALVVVDRNGIDRGRTIFRASIDENDVAAALSNPHRVQVASRR